MRKLSVVSVSVVSVVLLLLCVILLVWHLHRILLTVIFVCQYKKSKIETIFLPHDCPILTTQVCAVYQLSGLSNSTEQGMLPITTLLHDPYPMIVLKSPPLF